MRIEVTTADRRRAYELRKALREKDTAWRWDPVIAHICPVACALLRETGMQWAVCATFAVRVGRTRRLGGVRVELPGHVGEKVRMWDRGQDPGSFSFEIDYEKGSRKKLPGERDGT